MREAARETHLKEVQAKAKPKRKRGKTAPSQPSEPATNPPSPQRDVKKVKADGAGPEPAGPPGPSNAKGDGDGMVDESAGDAESKKPKSKKPSAETLKAAWEEKERYGKLGGSMYLVPSFVMDYCNNSIQIFTSYMLHTLTYKNIYLMQIDISIYIYI